MKVLADKRETQRRGQALQKELTKQKERLAKLQANPALRGNYDLLTQYANTYGKQRHASLWGSFGCKVPTDSDREARFPKEGKKHYKPDCVNPEACKVYEFKPKGASGEREGADQKSDYEYNVPLYYNKLVRANGTFEPASSELGGDAVMKTLMQKCYRDGAIQLEVRLEYYDMCKAQYECTSE